MISMGEHYRATGEAAIPAGIYRVVGIGDGRVSLLRVTDADGRRRHTGRVERVPREALESAFEPADDPDAGFAPARWARNAAQGVFWSIRSAIGL